MSEWLKEHAWKACAGVILLPWVRIPLSPPSAFLARSPFAPAGPCCTVASMGAVLPRRILRSGPFARPDEARIRAAAAMLVDRLRPDQLILHGSAARGEMTEHSDLDFLSVRAGYPEPDRDPTQHRWHCAETGEGSGHRQRETGGAHPQPAGSAGSGGSPPRGTHSGRSRRESARAPDVVRGTVLVCSGDASRSGGTVRSGPYGRGRPP